MFFRSVHLFVSWFLLSFGFAEPLSESAVLWAEFVANPDDHSLIPNNAYAGYMRGERAIPEVPVVVDVRSFGGRGDGVTLNDDAIRLAIDAAWAAGGGAVQFPAGEFLFEEMILLHRDGVVLRGAGARQTVLRFQRPLVEVLGKTGGESEQWNWTGGLLWVGPGDGFALRERETGGKRRVWRGLNATPEEFRERRLSFRSGWENWRTLGEAGVLAGVDGVYARGARRVFVDDASALRAGDFVLMSWENPPDDSLWLEIAGHESFADGDWFEGWLKAGVPMWTWPVEVAAVDGNEVTLTQPLRVSIRPEYQVTFRKIGEAVPEIPPLVQQVGVEQMTLRMENQRPAYAYNRGEGWNALFFNRAWNAWVRDVEILYAETAVNVSSSKNVTVTDIEVFSPLQSKYISTNRVMSHDILYEHIRVLNTGTVSNGINTEWLSSGNVWSGLVMEQGTFDSHRMMAFDAIRTQIRLRNPADARPGGNPEAGPFIGRRAVHWNINIHKSDRSEAERGMWVLDPEQYSSGAQVGVRGASVMRRDDWFGMPPGDKGTVVLDVGRVPEPENLFEAQRRLRFPDGPPVPEDLPEAFRRDPHRPGLPYTFFIATPQQGRAPLTVALDAGLSSGRGDELSAWRWEFGDGNRGEGRSLTHTFEETGRYTIMLEVETVAGRRARFSETIVVGNRPPEAVVVVPETIGSPPFQVVFDARASRSAFGKIVKFDWAFGDGAQALDGDAAVFHTYTRLGRFTAQLRVTDDRGDSGFWEIPIRVSREPEVFARINFQPTNLSTPEGWIAEGREVFGEREDGLNFGWRPRAGAPRRRNSERAPDFVHDSFVHSAGSVWEIEVPNGEYEVRLGAGDATNIDSVYRVMVNEVLVLDGRPMPEAPWVTGRARVDARDGRLTVRDAPGSVNVKLGWIEILRVPSDE